MATLLTLDHFQDVPEVRLLSSTGITRFRWYYEPVRHPTRPGLSLAGFRLGVTPPTAGVSRVAPEICPDMPSPLPRWDREGVVARCLSRCQPSPLEAGSAPTMTFSRPAQRSLTLRPV